MVIDCGREISLDHSSIPADGKLYAIFNVALDQHHPVRLAEPFLKNSSGASLYICICGRRIRLCRDTAPLWTASGLPGYTALQFQDIDDLPDRAFWHSRFSCIACSRSSSKFSGSSGSALIPGPAVSARGTRPFCKLLHSGTGFVGTARFCSAIASAAGSALHCPAIHPAGERSAGTAVVPCSSCHFMASFVFIGHNLLCREGTTGQW